MNKYELMIILDSKKDEDELKNLEAKVENLIKSTEANNITKEVWGHRELAYPIRKAKKGYYVLFKFESEGLKNSSIEVALNMDDSVFRYLIIKDESDKIIKKLALRAERKAKNLARREEAGEKPRVREPRDYSKRSYSKDRNSTPREQSQKPEESK